MLIVGEEDVVASLEELTVRNYVFHGSSIKIEDKVVPQKASDEVKESGNRVAVYMTRNPLVALFTALCGGVDVGKRANECYMEINDDKVTYPGKQYFAVEKPENISEIGYIYVFDGRTPGFEEINGEVLSYEAVEPMFAIKIKKAEFKYSIEKISQ